MKLALYSACLLSTASAFVAKVSNVRSNVALNAASRREAIAKFSSAAAAFCVPAAVNAATGESPRFSVFGVIGDGTSYSEGAAYGSDQSSKVYSPYSVYGEASENSLYKKDDPTVIAKKKAVIAESRNRLLKLPKYIEKKQWFNVRDELTRYMYETRGAVRFLSKTVQQKEAAADFFQAIEKTDLSATRKKQSACADAAAASVVALDKFVSLI